MRLGLFMLPLHPPTRTFGACLTETTERVLLAERLGYDEVWLGEHFSATTEPIPSPLMLMASLIPQTRRVTVGTGVIKTQKLKAHQQLVGPFGTVLVTGMDWTGPNAAWESESMQRLAQEVMPALRQQTTAQAATAAAARAATAPAAE